VNAKAAGVNDYVTKPFSVMKLIDRVRALLPATESKKTLKIL
jgi:DNA-binding response OmpR family regulator